MESKSIDGGLTWTKTQKTEFVDPVCQASLLTYTYNGELTDTLLFSNPNNPKNRENLTVQLSPDSGKSWKIFKKITHKPSGYSDMVQLRNDKIGVLYESGEKESYERIDYTYFTIE